MCNYRCRPATKELSLNEYQIHQRIYFVRYFSNILCRYPVFGRVWEVDGLLFCQRDTFIPPITSIYTYWNQWKHWATWIFIDQKPIKKDTNITRVIDLIMHTLTLILLYCKLLCLKILCIFNDSCHILNLDNLYIFLNK